MYGNQIKKRILTIGVAALVVAYSIGALAVEKLILMPIADTSEISKSDKKYLYDVMVEAASNTLAGRIPLVHEQKVRSKINKKPCMEGCAISVANKIDAELVLLFELSSHDTRTVGFLKLLDTKTESVLSAKRFFTLSPTAAAIEQSLQAAVRYVLDARFLPLDANSKRALAQSQRAIPMQANIQNEIQLDANQPVPPSQPPQAVQQQAAPVAPVAPVAVAETDTPREPRTLSQRKKVYIGVGAAMAVLAVGGIISGAAFMSVAGDELDKADYWAGQQAILSETVETYDMTNWNSDQFRELLNTTLGEELPTIDLQGEDIKYTYSDLETVYAESLPQKKEDSDNAATTNFVIGGLSFGVALGSGIVSALMFVKLAKLKRTEANGGPMMAAAPRLMLAPMIARKTSGLMLSTSF